MGEEEQEKQEGQDEGLWAHPSPPSVNGWQPTLPGPPLYPGSPALVASQSYLARLEDEMPDLSLI